MKYFRRIIEKDMQEEEIRNTSVNVNGFISQAVDFQDKLVQLQKEILKVVQMQTGFWRELEKKNSNIQRLLSYGEKITKQFDFIKGIYDGLYEMSPNHITLLSVYGNYVKEVLNDDLSAQKILEK